MKTMCYRCMRNTGENGFCTVCGAPIRTQRDIGDDYLLPLGTRLDEGNIIVGEKLGRGGFGITYIALDTSRFGVIALKEFVPSFMINSMRIGNSIFIEEQSREQYRQHMGFFRNEALTLSKLNHPNIVRVFFEFEENNTCYYGMELLRGVNLHEWITRNGALAASDAYRMIEPILSALEYLHSKNMLHRDISPGNIFLREAPGRFLEVDPCLIDFGAAYDAQVAFSKSAPHIKSKGFSPPEQNAGREFYGQFSDVYALSAVLYYMVTCRTPVASEDRTLRGVQLAEPYTLKGNIPRAFSDVIMRGMAMNSGQRIQTVRELRKELVDALSGRPAPAAPTPPRIRPEPAPPKAPRQPVPPAPQPPVERRHTEDVQPPAGQYASSRARPGNRGWLLSLLGTVVDAALFAGLWKLIMTPEATRELVDGNVWLGGVTAFIVALVCNVITSLASGGTLGECLMQAPRESMDSGRAAMYALTQSIYPVALLRKLAGASGADAVNGTVGVSSGVSLRDGRHGEKTSPVGPSLEAVNPSDRRVKVKQRHLSKSGQTLGRDGGEKTICDIPVSDSMGVSRKHCAIGYDRRWYIEDLNSKNGTYVNGSRIAPGNRVALQEGYRIILGEDGIEYLFHEQ